MNSYERQTSDGILLPSGETFTKMCLVIFSNNLPFNANVIDFSDVEVHHLRAHVDGGAGVLRAAQRLLHEVVSIPEPATYRHTVLTSQILTKTRTGRNVWKPA